MNIPQLKSRQGGFTMIELIVVMVILGILAAFAIPRFANLTGEARLAAINGTKAGVSSAVTIVRSKWLASGSVVADVVLEDGTAIKNNNGYPTAAADGICLAFQYDEGSIDCKVTDGKLLVSLDSKAGCSFEYSLNLTGTVAVGVDPLVVAGTNPGDDCK